MSTISKFPEIKKFIHIVESEAPAPKLSVDTVTLYQGRLCAVTSVRNDGSVTAVSEEGARVTGKSEEFYPLSDGELLAILEERRKNNPPGVLEEVKVVPRIVPPPPGGNMPAPPAEHQVYCRIWNRRWSRNGFPQATVSLLGEFVQFNCTIFQNGKTMLPGSRKAGWVQVFWGKENKTPDLCSNIARRIVDGALETSAVEGTPKGLIIKITGQKKAGRNGKVGLGRIYITWKKMTVSVPYTIFESEDGFNVALPSFNGRDTINFYAVGQLITADIKGATLTAWGALTGNEVKASRPAPKEGKHPRACGSCRYCLILNWQERESRSTWDTRDRGEMAPYILCLHLKRVAEAGGAPVPIDARACELGNEALRQYGRDVREQMIIWVTAHKRGKTQTFRKNDLWTNVCPLHTYRNETDTSNIKINGEKEGVIRIISRISFADDAVPQKAIEIPFTW